MVTKISPSGLIATTRAEVTPPLDRLATCCGWPLLLAATPRRLAHELALHDPQCVLFWLEDRHDLSPMARLVTWSRERGARPYRVAVALRIDAEVEAVFRAAGAHSVLSIDDCSGDSMADALWPIVESSVRATSETAANLARWPTAPEHEAAFEKRADLVRPP